ncbi:glutathione ABC transporter permease GsiC [Allokutzneria multivorans]|uniref:Glutathione ABC transporter permease GsiC n=1 Tax=Allokutzneria multivorans TaxID=1142134 RepID=A0ABP7U3P8_9PSEU
MLQALLRRAGQALLTLFIAAVVVWSLQLVAPGDPARRVLGALGFSNPTDEQIASTRRELGLDVSAPQRLLQWLLNAVTGDFGTSWRTGRPVTGELVERLPATLRLAVVALLLALLVAVPLALVAARWRGRAPDVGARAVMFLGAATPSFVVGTVVLELIVLRGGIGRVLADGSWGGAVLPAIPLALGAGAGWARVLRTSLVEVSDAPFIQISQARGATPLRRLLVHAMPSALPALLAAIGLTVGSLLAGAAVVETVFTWPGIGRYLIEAIGARDVPVVQATVLLGVLGYVVVSTVVDGVTIAITGKVKR